MTRGSREQAQGQAQAQAAGSDVAGGAKGVDLSKVKPLPVWFFGFEGVIGAAYDLMHVWKGAWVVLVALAAVNIVVGLTVMGRRRKLVRAMLKNSRTRMIAIGLIAARLGAHLLLGAAGTQVTSAAGHLVFAVAMAGATVTLLWVDQRITFRALGLGTPKLV
ncbi:hypothetical protein [Streptomyces sp. ICBB 8177]|uniref:hypothetical protein n=1 Tax=Streptomyces sp. ICBB 8177 TaxID=563922 RepID=UPI001F54172C|nr:hypothetical protein [Streptomyces sp. ICBB 8177]